jgi:AraC-like DNA-binding protein
MNTDTFPSALEPSLLSYEWERVLQGRVKVTANATARLDVIGLDLAGIEAALLDADTQTVDFLPSKIAPSLGEIVDFWYARTGTVLFDQAGCRETAAADLVLATDRTAPLRIDLVGPVQLLHVAVPAVRMGLSPRETAHLRGRSWRRGDGTATLLLPVMSGFCDSIDQLGPSATAGLGYHLTDLIAVAAGRTVPASRLSRDQVRSDLLKRIQAFALQHLHNPALCPSYLAREHNVSLRYLQKLFQESGLRASQWIRRERLDRCRCDLRDPRKADVSIAAIGRRWGFTTPSYFTRVFREEFGLTPRQLRGVYDLEGAR